MENFKEHINLYSYVFNRTTDNYEISNKDGLKIGLLFWPTITGEAQEFLKKVIKPTDEFYPEINTNFFTSNPLKAVKWISAPPIAISNSFTVKYAKVFFDLIKATEKEQYAFLEKKYKALWNTYCKMFAVKAENIKALVLSRILEGDLTRKDIVTLSYLGQTDEKKLIDLLNNSTLTNLYLTDTVKHIPGRIVEVKRNFPWVFPEE